MRFEVNIDKEYFFVLAVVFILLVSASFAYAIVSHPASQVTAGTFGIGNFSFNGHLGIGTANPEVMLDIQGGKLRATSGGVSMASPSTGKGIEIFYYGPEDAAYIYSVDRDTLTDKPLKTSSYNFSVNTNGLSRIFVDNSGYVGIGTASPGTKLDVSGVITATGGTSTNWNTAYVHSTTDADTSASNEIQTLGTSGNTVTLTSGGSVTAPYATQASYLNTAGLYYQGGNVGIGTSGPGAKLEVAGSVIVTSNGNLGLGITNPLTRLHMDGRIRLESIAGTGSMILYVTDTGNSPPFQTSCNQACGDTTNYVYCLAAWASSGLKTTCATAAAYVRCFCAALSS